MEKCYSNMVWKLFKDYMANVREKCKTETSRLGHWSRFLIINDKTEDTTSNTIHNPSQAGPDELSMNSGDHVGR